jgi:hypothetical protein
LESKGEIERKILPHSVCDSDFVDVEKWKIEKDILIQKELEKKKTRK